MPFDVLQNWWHFSESSGHAPKKKQGPGFITAAFATGNKTHLEISSNILEKYKKKKKHSSKNLEIKKTCICLGVVAQLANAKITRSYVVT